MGAHLPAVAPALDMRRGKGFAEVLAHAVDNGAPVFPGGFVVGLDLRDGFGGVFFQLRELVAGQVEQVATGGAEVGGHGVSVVSPGAGRMVA